MGRPAMRDPHGRWSLAQVAEHAGVTHRVARTCAQAGYVDPTGLQQQDVTVLKVAAALLDAPRPSGPRTATSQAVTQRNQHALNLTRQMLDAPQHDALLLVVPTTAHLASGLAVVGLLSQYQAEPILLLPIGQWALALTAQPAVAS